MKPSKARIGPLYGSLTAKQESAALALAAGSTQDEAATVSGSGTRTIKTWIAEKPDFRQRVLDLRAEITSRALGKLTDSMVTAAETLDHLCRKGKSESVRLGAARAVMELGTKLRENVELEERIAALEAGQQQSQMRRIA